MRKIAELLLTFAKIGLFTFGGGYAMIALIEDNCVEKKNWITHDEMMNIAVIAESTPGPIAINCATAVGYRQAGIWGALAATFGVVVPSFIIIFVISLFLDNFLEITWIANAFRGIKLSVGILILNAGINMAKKLKKKPLPLGILIGTCLFMLTVNIFSVRFSSVLLLLIGGAFGLAWGLIKGEPGKKGGTAK